MDELAEKFKQVEWTYADKDPLAHAELSRRIAETGAKLGLITYSDLVRGVTFHLPNIRNGEPYTISVYDWTGLDRRIIGEFLGYISMASYSEGGFLASALVVNKLEYKPSDIFFEWMRQLGVLPNLTDDTVLAFWADQVNKGHNWYRSRRRAV